MENAQQALENALILADMDFNRILYTVNNDFEESIDSYLIYVRQLGSDFELALSSLVLYSSAAQISTFALINLKKIDLAIKAIKVFDDLCIKYQKDIDNSFSNREIIYKTFKPIQQAHLSQLVYIKELLNSTMDSINGKTTQTEGSVEEVAKVSKIETENLLSEFAETLSIKDIEKIFHCTRSTIYRWEMEGRFKRCSPKGKTVLYKKEDIKRILGTSGIQIQ
ncbi:MAG: helix-turn-helix domain-containing protein [Bacteroidota bacterium]|nr:helix-turn-helix domain-containing protein [Bacteroidota bacterium]